MCVGPREHTRPNGEAEHIRAALLPELMLPTSVKMLQSKF
jgi:hypothetical protein